MANRRREGFVMDAEAIIGNILRSSEIQMETLAEIDLINTQQTLN